MWHACIACMYSSVFANVTLLVRRNSRVDKVLGLRSWEALEDLQEVLLLRLH